MGPLVALLICVGVFVAWAFFSFQPEWANKRALSIFNWSVIAACLMVSAAAAFNVQVIFGPAAYAKYRAPLVAISGLGVEIGFLTVMFLLRNFWIFKPPRRPGGW